jgi:hypothetical protein
MCAASVADRRERKAWSIAFSSTREAWREAYLARDSARLSVLGELGDLTLHQDEGDAECITSTARVRWVRAAVTSPTCECSVRSIPSRISPKVPVTTRNEGSGVRVSAAALNLLQSGE